MIILFLVIVVILLSVFIVNGSITIMIHRYCFATLTRGALLKANMELPLKKAKLCVCVCAESFFFFQKTQF